MARTNTKQDPLATAEWVQETLWAAGIMPTPPEARHIADQLARILPKLYMGANVGDARLTVYISNGFVADVAGPQAWLPRPKASEARADTSTLV